MYIEFSYLFLQSLVTKILLTEILFSPFLQLCVALEILLLTLYNYVYLLYVSLAYQIFIKNFPFRYCKLVEVDQKTEKLLLQNERNE